MKLFLEKILFALQSMQFKNVFDILLFSVFLSFIIYIFLQTRSYGLLGGILILVFVYFLSDWFDLSITKFFFQEIFKILPIILIIIFHREIRLFLAKIGFLLTKFRLSRFLKEEVIINEILEFLKESQKQKIGSILVFERSEPLEQHLTHKTKINADLSKDLLLSIFEKNSPLHDGAVIIKNNKIKYASSILPISNQALISPQKGTRHKAGLGITEESDALAIIVSEETGSISIAFHGKIKFDVSIEEAQKNLEKYFNPPVQNSLASLLNINIYSTLRFLIIFLTIFFLTAIYWITENYAQVKIQKIIEVPVEFKNLNDNFVLKGVEPLRFKITLSGYKNDLGNLDENNVKAIINLDNFEIGKYILDINQKDIVNIPKNIEVLNIEPKKIKFFIEQKNNNGI
jgi:uncharacterized protein (TIGR00159 family)